MYSRYHGRIHRTDKTIVVELPEPLTADKLLLLISRLNREAHVYGITYYTEEEDYV